MGGRLHLKKKKHQHKHQLGTGLLKNAETFSLPEAVAERREIKKKQHFIHRLASLLQQGNELEAESLLPLIWPQEENRFGQERIQQLLLYWPDRFIQDLQSASVTDLARPEVISGLADAVLFLTPESFQKIEQLEAPFMPEARLVRQAAALIAEGDDEAAQQLLRQIGLRSPFREARLFLRGLSALYRSQDEEARQAFQMLGDSATYGLWVRAALSALVEVNSEPQQQAATAIPPVEQAAEHSDFYRFRQSLLQALNLSEILDRQALRRICEQLRHKHPNSALGEVARAVSGKTKNDPLCQMLWRDLPAAFAGFYSEPKEIVDRLRRALPQDPEDPKQHRVQALLWENFQYRPEAIRHWQAYMNELSQGLGPFDTEERRLAVAAVHHKLGQMEGVLAQAKEEEEYDDDEDGFFNPLPLFDPFEKDPKDNPHWQNALRELEAAVDTAPEELPYWKTFLTATKDVGQKRDTDKLLERFVLQFPENPEALLAAAQAAADREAFDKGLGYVRRAAVLEPLNRSTRDMEAFLLIRKARKKFTTGKNDAATARRLYDEAQKVPYRTLDSQIKVAAESAALAEISGIIEEALVQRAQYLASDPRPWVWTGYFLIGQRHLQPRQNTRRGRTSPRRSGPTGLQPLSLLQESPLPEEVVEALQLARSYEQQFGSLSEDFYQFIKETVDRGGMGLTERNDLEHALEFAYGQARLRLAEQGQRLFPQSSRFIVERYHMAMMLKLPTEYFSQADQEIVTCLHESATTSPENEPMFEEVEAIPDFMEMTSHIFGPPPTKIQLRHLQREIQRYLRKRSSPSAQNKRSKKKSTDAAQLRLAIEGNEKKSNNSEKNN